MSGTANTRARRRPYRSVSTIRTAWFITACFVAALVIAAVPARGQVAGFIFAPIFAVATWRFWHLGVYVEGDGIKVVGSVITKRVAWREIKCFEVKPFVRSPYQGYVVLKNDRPPIPILAIGASGRPKSSDAQPPSQAQKPIDQLNELLAEWRDADRATSDEPAESAQRQS